MHPKILDPILICKRSHSGTLTYSCVLRPIIRFPSRSINSSFRLWRLLFAIDPDSWQGRLECGPRHIRLKIPHDDKRTQYKRAPL